MKLVVVSDLHADWTTLGVSRAPEIEEALALAVRAAIDEDADGFLCLGDVADPDTGGASLRASAMVVRAALDLDAAHIPSVWLVGNHDVWEDGSGASVLEPLAALEGKHHPLIHVAKYPRRIDLVHETEPPLALVCLPFAPVSHTYDPAAAARDLLPATGRSLVLAHLSVPGIAPGEETSEMPRGRDVVFPLAETVGATGRMNGHYHKQQVFDPRDGGPPIIVPGSLARLTFGEQDHAPAFLVVEV